MEEKKIRKENGKKSRSDYNYGRQCHFITHIEHMYTVILINLVHYFLYIHNYIIIM